MKALCWNGIKDLRVETVPDPTILNPRDAIVKVTMSSVCGSDLHLYNGFVPTMREGDIIGHEFMGEIVETGKDVQKLKKGDRVVIVSVIGCGECHYCNSGTWSLCDNSNPHAIMQEKVYNYSTAGIFGYSHLFGGYAGSHAQYIRVPFADNGAFVIPEDIPDEKAVFLSDALPTGYMAAEMGNIKPGDVVAVWGAGGVGQMAMQTAYLMGADKVIAIDRFDYRLQAAAKYSGAEALDYEKTDILEALKEATGGRGPDVCIDAVGMEARSTGIEQYYDKTKQVLRMESDRPAVLRQAIMACRKGGTISVVGVYAGLIDKFPMGVLMNKGLSMRGGQMHGQRYVPILMNLVQEGRLDPSFLLTHPMPLEAGPDAYAMFNDKADSCMRAVFMPNM
ncbi:zinc-dependent alcohol dehydrogenase [Pedobacter sp. SYSU D00535]|uniref:zinc-dependent alcohol dehydrogenase n=1 Tax=Pedobacter sp. SYSU D00535 TaxID=2810308 RepID=UPI001A972F53|nr:zinc-dependent alcohol dehydrogenase [Pedobacter sp. SYSU D00535]